MANKYLEKIAKIGSEYDANFHLSNSNLPEVKSVSGMGANFNTLSKARQAGVKPVAKAGGVLEAVRKMKGLRRII